jgi:hypothetical protein
MLKPIVRGAMLIAASFALGTHGALAEDPKPAPEVTPVQPMTVYDTALAAGWDNWSWAKVELSVDLSGSPRKPIKVEAGPWAALYLHHAPFDTTGLSKLSLLIQGSAPDREARVFMLADGKAIGEGKLVKFSNTGWTQVVIPLVTLGAEGKVVDGIWVQNASATDLPRFYVTDIKLD